NRLTAPALPPGDPTVRRARNHARRPRWGRRVVIRSAGGRDGCLALTTARARADRPGRPASPGSAQTAECARRDNHPAPGVRCPPPLRRQGYSVLPFVCQPVDDLLEMRTGVANGILDVSYRALAYGEW